MAIAIALYNGFSLGLERTVNRPIWGINGNDEWDIILFTGFVLYLGMFRFQFGDFYELVEPPE
jgi:hypothetical protein